MTNPGDQGCEHGHPQQGTTGHGATSGARAESWGRDGQVGVSADLKLHTHLFFVL